MSARFSVDFGAKDQPFIIELHDEATIQQARRIVSGEEKLQIHVQGLIVGTTAAYNTGYSFHLDPASISFFTFATEVCDAAPQYVEEHISEIGGAFLPGKHWCPWASCIVAEVA